MATTTTTYEPTTTTTIYYDDDDDALGPFRVYPASGFNTWIAVEDAEVYFNSRLNSTAWNRLDSLDQEAALLTAFRTLSALQLDITDQERTNPPAVLLKALQQAQCEQALHELIRDLDSQQAESVSIAGLLSAKMAPRKKSDRYSERALEMLRAWLVLPSIKRFR